MPLRRRTRDARRLPPPVSGGAGSMPAPERARSAEEGEASEAEGRAAVGPDHLDDAHQHVDPNHDRAMMSGAPHGLKGTESR